MKQTFFYILALIISFDGFTQQDTLVNTLKEVVIHGDPRLKQHSVGYKVQTLNDSVLLKNTESFTNVLRFNSPLYLRENGVSGVSSASFRGTSATNTAVIWNGININAVNNGQTDFNALTVSLYDGIDIRSGGGSLEYGSGAIGGSIHLNDDLVFSAKKKTTHQFVLSAGSFEAYNSLYKFKMSQSKLAINAGVSYNESENDYPLYDTDFKNENGAFKNLSLNFNAALLLSKYSKLKFYNSNYWGERFFSGELPNPETAKDKYQNSNNYFLLVYTQNKYKLKQEARMAYLFETYRYFADRAFDDYDFGRAKRYRFNYDLSYRFLGIDAQITSYSEYESTLGKADKISEKHRKQFSQSIVYKHDLSDWLNYEAKVRQDFNSDYKIPFTYALGAQFKASSQFFIRTNGSKNYRVPTYNDLYWPSQGNLSLVPESALQGELGIGFKNDVVSVDAGVFYIASNDKITWIPNGDPERPGVWVPINIDEVTSKGVEIQVGVEEQFHKHIVKLQANYSFTQAIDEATKKQVIFTPEHLFKTNLSYNYKLFGWYYQQLYNGMVYTTASNSEDFVVPAFFVANTGVDFKVLHTLQSQLSLGVKINNLFNEKYVVRPRRPMPNRNFNINLNYKF
ncbi:TonB-dependent receptor [Tamlana fucoidanivorans]|uniref:TonB-dependent receptor n=1 Tax=Allotamlana fucoidanivorans TaxID=2583814 RepID=A0A5C4SID3_9FLAO|nr:TonB-dependent receptor [Tamlana fucoidanivorans]TNJ43462.1 TonB-dependent receptor [Tamlana fucoidanivorans]